MNKWLLPKLKYFNFSFYYEDNAQLQYFWGAPGKVCSPCIYANLSNIDSKSHLKIMNIGVI